MSRDAGIFSTTSERSSEDPLCRLCLKNNDYFYNIFTSNVACRMTVKDAINGLLGLKVAVGDGLPNTLCPICLKKLTELSVFKMTCLQSDAKLRKLCGGDCLRSIQGDEATDDKLGFSADTKDFIQDEIQGTSHLTHSVQKTEIYIPLSDYQQPGANMLSIGGEGAVHDNLRSSTETKDFVPDVMIRTLEKACSVQTNEIFIPVPDIQLPTANILMDFLRYVKGRAEANSYNRKSLPTVYPNNIWIL